MYQLFWFFQNVPGLKFTFDMGNFAFSNENAEVAYDFLKNYIVHVHCKDRGLEKIKSKNFEEEIFEEKFRNNKGLAASPFGSGYIPIEKLVKKILACGYDGYFAIEHFDAPDQLLFMKKSAEFLHSITK